MLTQPAEQPDEWVSAANAVALLGMTHFLGTRTICKRAHAGLITARAERFIRNGQSRDNVDIPTDFWWAQGGAALHQNWTTGDFDTWIDHRIHVQAFGVTFRRSEIERAKPTTVVEKVSSIPSKTEPLKFSDVVTLKPTLWGMSIDLLKVWNWLRERWHSTGRKQEAMAQFPETPSMLNRLWRDPVWSIVIATGITAGITAGIGALAWYFHTPPPATTPPAIPAAPPVVTQQSPQSSPTTIDVNQYSRKTCFDYSTNNGVAKVNLNAIIFEIRFSERSTDSIYVYKDNTNLRAIAALRGVTPGEDVNFAAFDSSSRAYWVPLDGFFIAQNMDGYFLLARILSIKAADRGAANDEVCFAYSIDASKTGKFKAF